MVDTVNWAITSTTTHQKGHMGTSAEQWTEERGERRREREKEKREKEWKTVERERKGNQRKERKGLREDREEWER